jgi:hypothetical protein
MADEKKKKQQSSNGQALVTAISAAVGKGLTEGLSSFIKEQKETNKATLDALKSISASQEELVKGIHAMATTEIDAASEEEEDEEVEIDAAMSNPSDATMASARKKDASNASDATDATDPSDATDVDAGIDPTNFTSDKQGDDATPGDLNQDATSHYDEQSKGPASSQIQKTGKDGKSRGIAASKDKKGNGVMLKSLASAAVKIRTLMAANQKMAEENKRFRNRVAALEASVERYAERVERRTITPEIASLLEKGGHDVRELMASKQRLTVAEVDDLFLKSNIQLEPAMRAAFKNQLLQAGLMEQGEVRRWAN